MKKIYTLSFFALIYTISFAQGPIIQANDFRPIIGENFNLHSTDYVSEGANGENITWDFSNLTSLQQIPTEIAAPSSEFSSSTYSMKQDENYTYYDFSGNDLNMVGTKNLSGGQNQTMIFTNPMTSLKFPLKYGDNFTDSYAANIQTHISGTTVNVLREGNIVVTVDGYGTLITPSGTFENVLRVKLIDELTDTYGPEYGNMVLDTYLENYMWLTADIHMNLLQLVTGETSGQPVQSGFYIEASQSSGIQETEMTTLSLFPNPASDVLTISTTSTIENVVVTDISGKKVNVEIDGEKLDVSKLTPGVYIITVKTVNGIVASKFVKE